jgi:hypothetical protein
MPKTSYGWLIIGALVGFVIVVIVHFAGLLSIPGWIAALATTLSAVVFERGGRVKEPVMVRTPAGAP